MSEAGRATILTLVALARLLWYFGACGFEDGARSGAAGLDGHEQSMAAAETKYVSLTHIEVVIGYIELLEGSCTKPIRISDPRLQNECYEGMLPYTTPERLMEVRVNGGGVDEDLSSL